MNPPTRTARPITNRPVAMAPCTKYLRADSSERLVLASATSAYPAAAAVSSATRSINRSKLWATAADATAANATSAADDPPPGRPANSFQPPHSATAASTMISPGTVEKASPTSSTPKASDPATL